jgi:hypothetical protein
MRRARSAALLAAAIASGPAAASAEDATIGDPGDHPEYRFELEPHGLVGFGGPFRKGQGELGAGVRATVIVVDNGFVKTINNSVGISFGADAFFGRGTVFIPVALQWNFWLSVHWSVFAEPGIGLAANTANRDLLHPVLMAGGRYHFTEKIALTLRLGYPAFSVGVSFLF